jgi:hypothetical protein
MKLNQVSVQLSTAGKSCCKKVQDATQKAQLWKEKP